MMIKNLKIDLHKDGGCTKRLINYQKKLGNIGISFRNLCR